MHMITKDNAETTTTTTSSSLAGRTALVTGASSGIGRATALELARAGASVALLARRADRLDDLAEEINGDGGLALALATDVTDYDSVAATVVRAEETLGGIDIVINSAGIMLPGKIAESDPADWQQMVQVNLMGALHTVRAVLPGMQARGRGNIINISSNSGRVHQPHFSVYAATKHALGAFTTILRKEVYPSRIRVTLFEPGATTSELASHADQDVLAPLLADMGGTEEMELLTPEDVARGILWTTLAPEHVHIGGILYTPTDQRDW